MSEGLRFENLGRILLWEAQADGYKTAFDQFNPPNLTSYPQKETLLLSDRLCDNWTLEDRK